MECDLWPSFHHICWDSSRGDNPFNIHDQAEQIGYFSSTCTSREKCVNQWEPCLVLPRNLCQPIPGREIVPHSLTHSLTHSQIGPVGLWPLKMSDLQNIIHVPQHLTQWDTNGCGWGVKKGTSEVIWGRIYLFFSLILSKFVMFLWFFKRL